jgi:hypothetical protein
LEGPEGETQKRKGMGELGHAPKTTSHPPRKVGLILTEKNQIILLSHFPFEEHCLFTIWIIAQCLIKWYGHKKKRGL